jgi:hypothetical protein
VRSGHYEHVAWRKLHDALGDRAVQRTSDEIAAATPTIIRSAATSRATSMSTTAGSPTAERP